MTTEKTTDTAVKTTDTKLTLAQVFALLTTKKLPLVDTLKQADFYGKEIARATLTREVNKAEKAGHTLPDGLKEMLECSAFLPKIVAEAEKLYPKNAHRRNSASGLVKAACKKVASAGADPAKIVTVLSASDKFAEISDLDWDKSEFSKALEKIVAHGARVAASRPDDKALALWLADAGNITV